MIASAEVFADLRQGAVGISLQRYMAICRGWGKLRLRLEDSMSGQLDAVLFADGFFDGLAAVDIEIACGKDIVKILFSGVFHIDVCLEQLGITDDMGKSALQFTDVELDFFCDQIDDSRKSLSISTCSSSFLTQDGYTGLIVRRLYVGYDIPLKPNGAGSSSSRSLLGWRSLEITICLPESWSLLKVWKKTPSVWNLSLPETEYRRSEVHRHFCIFCLKRVIMPRSPSALISSDVKTFEET